MKQVRRMLALCLCLTMILSASGALAASSKEFTKVPTIKLRFSKSVESYDTDDLTVTTNAPGFLTLRLLTSGGSEVLTVYDDEEVRSGANEVEFSARDQEGEPLPAGSYMFSASMVSQFGVASKEATVSFEIDPMSAEAAEAYADMKAGVSSSSSSAQSNVGAGAVIVNPEDQDEPEDKPADTQKPEATKKPEAKATATPKPSAHSTAGVSDLSYTSGTFAAGDEGLMIGVGVDDTATQEDAGYWGLTADASDEEIWAALTRTMVASNADEQESAYIYNSPKEGRKKLGTISGFSQGVNLIVERDDGWSLVEAYRNEDGAFVRGYIRSNRLRTVEPDQTYGVVIDKAEQTLTVYKEGQRVGSTKITTGLPTAKYPHRDTPAGEFVLATRRGTTEYYGQGFSKYSIRLNGSYYLCEIPSTKKNGTNFSILEELVGERATRGHICVPHEASTDGGINAEWIWNMTDGRKRVKVLIFDDKPRTSVPDAK
ncbi:MAG: L,D-transpeptidase family protein [Clostridia bacterium]|nr:L,D-transpeptidase family protein [Clostridia bacterium]